MTIHNLGRPHRISQPQPRPEVSPPAEAAQPVDQVVSSEITETPFNGFLKYKNYEVSVSRDGILERYRGGFVHGPGHHIAAVAAFAFDEAMTPHPILKTGDTRLARADRQEPYVLDGFIAGRMDKKGADSSKIALAELAEEVGGEVVGETFRKLGESLTPTMPFESTEADNYYLAAVEITGKPTGDGGGMEVTDIIGPKFSTPNEAIRAMDNGELSETGRTRALYGRGFDAIGYVPQLGVYVQDHPELAARYDTLGLGDVQDIRSQLKPSKFPEPWKPGDNLESQINDVTCTKREETALDAESRMIDAKTKHAVNKNGVITTLDKEFPNQYLQLDYDRAKVATYYIDPERGPMVEMKSDVRPSLAFAPDSPSVLRRDVEDIKIERDKGLEEQLPAGTRPLGKGGGASAGQTDLYYHYLAREVEQPSQDKNANFLPLGEAISLCRNGEGDAQTEALCERLADDLNWLPNLGMSVAAAKSLMK